MSEGHGEETPGERGAASAAPEPVTFSETAPPSSPKDAAGKAWPWLAGLLALVVAGVGTSPFWAPAVVPLLPWGEQRAGAGRDYAALAARLSAIEQRPAPPTIDFDAVKAAQSTVARRVDRLEAGLDADNQTQAAVAAAQATLQRLGQRLGAVDAQAASEAAALQKLQQQVAQLGSGDTDLAGRLATLERRAAAERSADRTGPALLLALLQMREAVEAARPFAAEYAAFSTLARGDRDLSAAAAPLAEAARDGVTGRAQLKQRLDALAERIEAPPPPPAAGDWRAQALSRLRSLVTIRRIDDAARTGPEAAVSAARAALARDDLPDAVAALAALTGAAAEAARPWLQMARARLAAETALARVQELLLARLGDSWATAPAGTPTTAPAAAPAKPGAPS